MISVEPNSSAVSACDDYAGDNLGHLHDDSAFGACGEGDAWQSASELLVKMDRAEHPRSGCDRLSEERRGRL